MMVVIIVRRRRSTGRWTWEARERISKSEDGEVFTIGEILCRSTSYGYQSRDSAVYQASRVLENRLDWKVIDSQIDTGGFL